LKSIHYIITNPSKQLPLVQRKAKYFPFTNRKCTYELLPPSHSNVKRINFALVREKSGTSAAALHLKKIGKKKKEGAIIEVEKRAEITRCHSLKGADMPSGSK
jgi:hypothetical protein